MLWLLEGILGIVVGALTLKMRGRHLVLLMFVEGRAITGAVLRNVVAIQLSKWIKGEWLLRMNGSLSVLFGLMLAAVSAASILSLVLLNGARPVVVGIFLAAISFRLRRVGKGISALATAR